MREESINDFLNSKLAAVPALLFYLACVFCSGQAVSPVFCGAQTLCFVAVLTLVALLHKRYSFIRSVTFLYGTIFFVLLAMFPALNTQLHIGSTLCLTTVVLQFPLFASYQKKRSSTQRVFIVFALLSLGAMHQRAFVMLMVAFFIGFLQMRSMGFRGFLAMLLGIGCPWWMGVGFGLIHISALQMPSWEWSLEQLLATPIATLIAVAVMAVLAIVLTVANGLTTINYRLQLRVYNSFYTILTLLSVVMMVLDINNLLCYIPVFCYCLSIQVAQAFSINAGATRRYVPVLLLIGICVASACFVL